MATKLPGRSIISGRITGYKVASVIGDQRVVKLIMMFANIFSEFIENLIAEHSETETQTGLLLVTHRELLLLALPGLFPCLDVTYILEHRLGYTVLTAIESQNEKFSCL